MAISEGHNFLCRKTSLTALRTFKGTRIVTVTIKIRYDHSADDEEEEEEEEEEDDDDGQQMKS